MASLYSNENFPLQVVQRLRKMGHDVLTSHEAGKANQRIPDDEVLAYATELGRALLTLNRWDFINLHSRSNQHAGVVVCSQDVDMTRQAENIHKAIASAGNMSGVLVRVNRG